MIISVVKEIKDNENRVALTPAGAADLVAAGHKVYVEKDAGTNSGFNDEDYEKAGASIICDKKELFNISELILKVKEPLESEYDLLREDQILFTYLHLAPDIKQTQALIKRKIIAIGYETVEKDGRLPLLNPMSELAGRMAPQVGAYCLEKQVGGKGILLGGVPGVEAAQVVILGGGVVGINAAKMASGMGARVTVINKDLDRLVYIDDIFSGRITTVMSNSYNIATWVKKADLLIGAVLLPGSKTPKLVTEEMVKTMEPGSVIVDVAVDQGGCVETIDRVTTHSNPTYIKHGVVHYAVGNMPGATPRTSTLALTNATMPYVLNIANKGYKKALQDDPGFAKGLNLYKGLVTCPGVAGSQNLEYTDVNEVLK